MKKKVLVTFIIFSIIGISIFLVDMDIRGHFNRAVKTKSNINLYDKQHKKVGTIYQGLTFQLEKKKNTYFKLNSLPYYVYYKDVVKAKQKSRRKNENYLVFNQNIKVANNTIFYSMDNKKKVKIDKKISIPIQYEDDSYYYVNYLDNLLKVKKSDGKLVEKKNTSEKEASYVSVLHYEKIGENSKDTTDIESSILEEQLELLDNLGYHLISMDEYTNYLEDKVRLKKKAVLITTTKESNLEKIKEEFRNKIEIVEQDSPSFLDTNQRSTKENNGKWHNRYLVDKNTSLEDFQKMLEGKSVVKDPATEIPVLNYHFFYDESLGEGCNESICLDVKNFREQLDYLKNNNYKTLTMEEFKRWMYNEIELPKKSVLITIDDGAMGTGKHNGNKLIPILEEYKMHATLFLIAGWWNIENYRSDYLEIESHTFDMHNYGDCGVGQLICESKEKVISDLKKSIDIIKSTNAFCFPFYNYDKESIEAVQEVGFQLAFIGGYQKASRESDKYKIPRYPIYQTTSIKEFVNMLES